MKIPFNALFGVVSQLGSYLKLGLDHYADLRTAGQTANVDVITSFVGTKMEEWNPEVGGVALLDTETRTAAARFIAGVAVKLAST